MSSIDIIELTRAALVVTLLVSAPVLLAGMLVGVVIGLLQALTQIQEQTVAFVPKLVATIAVLSLAMPWIVAQMVEYTQELIVRIPENL